MNKYSYFYYGESIQKERFQRNVPSDWEQYLDEFGSYSNGGYRAIKL